MILYHDTASSDQFFSAHLAEESCVRELIMKEFIPHVLNYIL